MCLLGVPKTKFDISTPFSLKTQIFRQFSTGLRKFRDKKALTIIIIITFWLNVLLLTLGNYTPKGI